MAKKELERDAAQEMDADHAELRVYELGFHIDPELSEGEVKKVYGAIRAKAEAAGSIVAEGEPQKIPLAYTVSRSETAGRRDFDASFFAWVAYEATGAGHEAVTELAGATASIFRFIDIRTDKESAQHAAEMHEIMLRTAKETEEQPEEVVSETEIDAALKEVA